LLRGFFNDQFGQFASLVRYIAGGMLATKIVRIMFYEKKSFTPAGRARWNVENMIDIRCGLTKGRTMIFVKTGRAICG
jgi:hypothetical protein